MAEGNGLENRRRETVPEFESLLLRHITDPRLSDKPGVFLYGLPPTIAQTLRDARLGCFIFER